MASGGAGGRHRWVLLAAVVGFACDLPPIEYETEHLRIGTDSDEPICAGTLDELEARVRVVEEVLEVRVEKKLELYLFEGGVTGWCSEEAAGCYSRREKRVYTPLEHAGHEIVHAAVHQTIGGSDALFNEGFAVDLTGASSGFPSTYPASNLGLSSIDVSRSTAGHFMRWLRSRYEASEIKSIVKYSKLGRSASHAEDAFEKATNDEFAEIEQLYLETAPEYYAPFDIVTPPMVGVIDQGGWDIVLGFDCTDVSTQGFAGKMWRRVRIEVTEPGLYVLATTYPATATIAQRRTEDIQAGEVLPTGPFWQLGDDGFSMEIPGGAFDVELEPGLYDVEIHVPGTSPTTAGVRLYPKLGPVTGRP